MNWKIKGLLHFKKLIQKKNGVANKGIGRLNDQKRKDFPHMETPHDIEHLSKNHVTMTKTGNITRHKPNIVCRSAYKQQCATPKKVQFSFPFVNHLFQLPTLFLENHNPWLNKLLLPWTIKIAPTMWIFKIVNTDSDIFLGSKTNSTSWM